MLFGMCGVIVAMVIVGMIRNWDIRLTLLIAAELLASIIGDPMLVVREFLTTFSNPKFVIPICSAMGFAYVLKETGCDRNLVLILLKPLRQLRLILIPGVILVGFLVNIPVISQTSTAICIGAVVIPILQAASFSPRLIAATLILGSSIGGELCNPGAPELNTIVSELSLRSGSSMLSSASLVSQMFPVLLPHLFFTGVFFFFWSRYLEKKSLSPLKTVDDLPMDSLPTNSPSSDSLSSDSPSSDALSADSVQKLPGESCVTLESSAVLAQHGSSKTQTNDNHPTHQLFYIWSKFRFLFTALVPIVPLVLLFLTAPPLRWVHIPESWYIQPQAHSLASTYLIGAAMLFGCVVAGLAVPRKIPVIPKAFFEGAGAGLTQVVSLIITANCFGKAIEKSGLAGSLGAMIQDSQILLWLFAVIIPFIFAWISGSGMASTQSLFALFVEPSYRLGVDPIHLGIIISISSAAGRTMSPFAAVMLMGCKLCNTKPFLIIPMLALPLLLSLFLVFCLCTMKVL